MKVFIKILLYLGLFSLLGFLLVRLFFLDEYNAFKESVLHTSAIEKINVSYKTLNIAYAFGPVSLEPTYFDSVTRGRLVNIYEALVKTDKDLRIEPCLAVSWGRLNDTTWEFVLRPDVLFHDGTKMSADDVVNSFERAQKYSKSQLDDVLKTIKSVNKIDDLTVEIITQNPDPLLVNKISSVLIFPKTLKDFEKPVGTAPYKYISSNSEVLILERFEEYWGAKPYFREVLIKTISNRFDRLDQFKKGEIDILANVPPSLLKEITESGTVSIDSLPSLEVNFLVFNMNGDLFNDKRLRKAVSLAFNKNEFIDFTLGYAQPSDQFVSNGIFGFNPDIIPVKQDIDEAKTIIRDYDPFKRVQVVVDMAEGTELVGDYIKDQLNNIGMSAEINILPFEELEEKIKNHLSEIYYLGWKSEMGDASNYYENAVYSKGKYNGGAYINKKVDQLIELSLSNLDQEKRLEQLHEIMKIIVEEDIIGVPLFESDVIYGIRTGIKFKPRLDGNIIASDIS
jgi:peptide/nickel transport system substrate-binding protein